MPKDLPDDPVLLKRLLEQMLSERESDKGKIVHLEEENAVASASYRAQVRVDYRSCDPANGLVQRS
jgi:hypothetical protein